MTVAENRVAYIRSTIDPETRKTGLPLVHVARGSMKGELSPDEARQMARHWTEAAIAAQIDARLRYVLGDFHQLTPNDVEEIFTKLQKVQR